MSRYHVGRAAAAKLFQGPQAEVGSSASHAGVVVERDHPPLGRLRFEGTTVLSRHRECARLIERCDVAFGLHRPRDARRQRVCLLVANVTDRLGLRPSNREAKLRFLLVVLSGRIS
jgi:hypothetical protein